jgi:hypothetical protein
MVKKLPRRTALAPLVALLAALLWWVAPPSPAQAYPLGQGYWMVLDDGNVAAFGDAQHYGDMGGKRLVSPIVGMASYPFLEGYWLVAADGGIFGFGGAKFLGSMGGKPLNRPIVGIASTPTGRGYWMVASDGGIFAFGDAAFFGSMGGKPLNRPIVAMASTPTGKGYWLTASDGGVFAFGDAGFFGSTGSLPLVRPVVGMTPTGTGKGYYMVASDGGLFAFGDAVFRGSMGGKALASPITAMALSTTGNGYGLAARDGGLFNFGDAPFFGSLAGVPKPALVRSFAIRPRLALEVAPLTTSGNAFALWTPDTLVLFYLGSPPVARLAGIEGIDVAQLGTVSFRLVNGDCPTFTLGYREANSTETKSKEFTCPADFGDTVGTHSFTPSASVPGNAMVTAFFVSFNGSPVIGLGSSEIDDITVAGMTATNGGVFRLP